MQTWGTSRISLHPVICVWVGARTGVEIEDHTSALKDRLRPFRLMNIHPSVDNMISTRMGMGEITALTFVLPL